MATRKNNRAPTGSPEAAASPGAGRAPCIVIALPERVRPAWMHTTQPAGYLPALVVPLHQPRAARIAAGLDWLIEAVGAAVRDGNGRAAMRYMDAAYALVGKDAVAHRLDELIADKLQTQQAAGLAGAGDHNNTDFPHD